MNQLRTYRCLAFSPFNFIRILVFGFLSLFLIIWIFSQDGSIALWSSAIVVLITELIYLRSTYTVLKSNGAFLEIQNSKRHIILRNLDKCKSWWSYDLGSSSPQIGDGGGGKSNPTANKINCFVKFSSNSQVAYIYEQIHLGEKFPNDLPYIANEPIDKSKLVKVWDITKCLKELQIIAEK